MQLFSPVSMGEETIGVRMVMLRVILVPRSTWSHRGARGGKEAGAEREGSGGGVRIRAVNGAAKESKAGAARMRGNVGGATELNIQKSGGIFLPREKDGVERDAHVPRPRQSRCGRGER
jgi:hypothetical protein